MTLSLDFGFSTAHTQDISAPSYNSHRSDHCPRCQVYSIDLEAVVVLVGSSDTAALAALAAAGVVVAVAVAYAPAPPAHCLYV